MRLRLRSACITASLALAWAVGATPAVAQRLRGIDNNAGDRARRAAYQDRRGAGPTDRFSHKARIGRDGRFSLANIAGDIVITGGPGDDVSIEAVKSSRGDQRDLADVDIDVDERAGVVEVRTRYRRRDLRVSVAYTVSVPTSASVDVRSVSGDVKVTGVQGSVRAESVSGNVTTSGTARLEIAKSVSGDVDLADAGANAELTASSVSGNVRAKGFRARSLDASTVSGDIHLTDVICDRLGLRSITGQAEYIGALAKNGRYDFNSHSGDIRLTLSESTGFEFNANTFSGTVRSDLPLVIGGTAERGRRGRRSMSDRFMRATFGDGSAVLNVRTFSGNIIISKQ